MNFFTLLKLKRTFSFAEYLDHAAELAGRKDTSGAEKTPERIAATKLNFTRLSRIYRTTVLKPELLGAIKKIDMPMIWLLILESWCGDGAQSAPVIARLAHQSPFVSLKIILRDEHPEIMDKYLTNGSRSIPKLIFFDTGTLKELELWGPRPANIQEAFLEYKKDHPGLSHDELMKELHLLYARDHSESLQAEMTAIMTDLHVKQRELVTL